MSFSADWPETARGRNRSDRTWREVEAPMAGDSRNSACRMSCALASSAGSYSIPRSRMKAEKARRARAAPR